MATVYFDSAMNRTKAVTDQKIPEIDVNFKMLGHRMYSGFLNILKVTFLILAFLAAYKILGVHDGWIQFLDKFVF